MAVLEEAAEGPQDKQGLAEGPLNDLLKTAVDADQASVAQRRKVFDAAPDFMRRTLIFALDPEVQAVRKTSFERAHELAVKYKERGNALFKGGKDKEALDEYSRGISVFRHFRKDGDDFVMVLQDKTVLSAEEAKLMHEVLLGCFLNAAACLLRSKRTPEAVYACQEALRIDSQNVKALYRRAMAFIQMDSDASLDAAEYDLNLAARLAPGGVEIKEALRHCKELKAAQDKKAKETYAGMFDKGKLYDDKETKRAPKLPGLPGEVSERDGTERVEIDAATFLKEGAAAGINMDTPWAKQRLRQLQEKEKGVKAKTTGPKPQKEGRRAKTLAIVKRAFDKRFWVSIPTLLYAIIFLNLAVRLFEFCQLAYYWLKDTYR